MYRILVLIILAGCVTGQLATDQPTLGGAFALSGFASSWGIPESQAAQLAIDEYNRNNGGNVRLLVEDTQSTSAGTLSATKKLIDIHGVDIIIGPSWLDSFPASAQYASETNTLLITPDASITAVPPPHPTTFSTWYRSDKAIEVLVHHWKKQGVNSVAVIASQDTYWKDLADQISQQMDTELLFTTKETSFNTLLTKSLESDAVYFGFQTDSQFLNFLQQANEHGITNLYGMEHIHELKNEPAFAELLDGVQYVYPVQHENDFEEKFIQTYEKKPSLAARNAYDATNIALIALQSSDPTALLKTETFQSVTFGEISFDELGGVQTSAYELHTVQ